MTIIQLESASPPEIAEVRRPHLSASSNAGMEIASISIAETPDARKDAVWFGRPACAKRVGAYWTAVSDQISRKVTLARFGYAHVEDGIDTRKLHHPENKQTKNRTRAVLASKY